MLNCNLTVKLVEKLELVIDNNRWIVRIHNPDFPQWIEKIWQTQERNGRIIHFVFYSEVLSTAGVE